MAKHKKNNIAPWLRATDEEQSFCLLTAGLLQCEPFRSLTPRQQVFYITLCAHKYTPENTTCLYNLLKSWYGSEYYRGEAKTNDDINFMVYGRRNGTESRLFVFPEKQAKEYGYKDKKQVQNLFKELQAKGFIKVYQKQAYKPTIWQFSDEWKK